MVSKAKARAIGHYAPEDSLNSEIHSSWVSTSPQWSPKTISHSSLHSRCVTPQHSSLESPSQCVRDNHSNVCIEWLWTNIIQCSNVSWHRVVMTRYCRRKNLQPSTPFIGASPSTVRSMTKVHPSGKLAAGSIGWAFRLTDTSQHILTSKWMLVWDAILNRFQLFSSN